MPHYEKKLDSKEVFRGKIISVRHDTVELENGRSALREVVEHPGAVVILPFDGEYIYMVRQFRYVFDCELLEVPAGKLEAGEDHRDAALRELEEETGKKCRDLVYLGESYPSPGLYREIFHMYFAGGLVDGQLSPDEDEFLSAVRVTPEELEGMIANGEIKDGKTVTILHLAKSRGLL